MQVTSEKVFIEMYLNDEFYVNKEFTLFSAVELPGYKKWSAWLKENFPGYEFDMETKSLKAGTNPTLNWEETKKLLLSKNWTPEQEAAFEDKLKNGSLFLDGAPKSDKIAFSSFLRSGNTLTRKYFEEITGVATGSIMHNNLVGNFTLFQPIFKADTTYDDRVLLFKTHLPFVADLTTQEGYIPHSKSLVCTRNPLDSLPSLF